MGRDAHFVLQYAGVQHGELHGIPEPPETWCNAMKFHDGPYRGGAAPRAEAAPAPPPMGSTMAGDARAHRHAGARDPLPAHLFQTHDFKFDPSSLDFDV